MKLVVLGAPGAGKGTQAHFLSQHYNIPHISTGTLLREHIKNKTAIGVQVEDLVNNGMLVSDDLIIKVLKDRFMQEDCADGFILDGFPRRLAQAVIIEEVAGKLDRVVLIHVEDEVIVQRISGRRICNNCGATWNLIYRPTKKEDVCDSCGGELAQRIDDKAKTVRERLRIHSIEEKPICEYFESISLLTVIREQDSIENTTKCIIEALSDI